MEGKRKPDIAVATGISLMTLYRWIEMYGWEEKYKQKYEEKLNKITDIHKKLLFFGLHRAPKVSKTNSLEQ